MIRLRDHRGWPLEDAAEPDPDRIYEREVEKRAEAAQIDREARLDAEAHHVTEGD